MTTATVPQTGESTMTFDSQRNVAVLLVGFGPLLTYERSGGNWSQRPSVNTTFNHAATYDSLRGVTVTIGGGSWPSSTGNNEVYEWDGISWLAQPAINRLSARHAVAFDAARGVTLLFGGLNGNGSPRADTWTWDGSTATQIVPFVSPQARHGHAMAFDSARGRVVLFGGSTCPLTNPGPGLPPSLFYADTWEWDGATWIDRTTSAPAPSARHQHAMAYDPTHGVTYLFGGVDATGNPLNDLWAWDGTAWTQLATLASPARRWLCAMTYDPARNKLVLFGGLNEIYSTFLYNGTAPFLRDTWEYTPGLTGTFSTFGAACSGSRGAPALSAWQGGTPVTGRSFRTQVANLPLTGPAFVFVGASKTSYGTLPLPFDLGAIGMPSCWLNVGADVVFPLTNVLGTALFDLDIPQGFAGASLYEQAVVFDPPANLLGLTTSKGAELKIGG